MKYLTLFIIIICQFSFSQTIVDMAESHNINWNRKNGQFYLKDVNGYFNDFLGTWKYEYDGNKEFRIILTKVEMYHVNKTWGSNTFDYYEDGLILVYQKYENGNLVYQSPTRDFPNGITKQYGKVKLTFFDYQRDSAGFNAILTLNQELQQGGIIGETKLHFKLEKFEAINLYHKEHPDEPYFSVPNDVLMTKVE